MYGSWGAYSGEDKLPSGLDTIATFAWCILYKCPSGCLLWYSRSPWRIQCIQYSTHHNIHPSFLSRITSNRHFNNLFAGISDGDSLFSTCLVSQQVLNGKVHKGIALGYWLPQINNKSQANHLAHYLVNFLTPVAYLHFAVNRLQHLHKLEVVDMHL